MNQVKVGQIWKEMRCNALRLAICDFALRVRHMGPGILARASVLLCCGRPGYETAADRPESRIR